MSEECRILDYNYLFDETVDVTASSEDSEFPVENLLKHHVAKVWRSNPDSGTFVIKSTNCQMKLKAQMEIVTVTPATYTVSYDSSTGLWTISTSHSYLDLLWASVSGGVTLAPVIGFTAGTSRTGATSYTGASVSIHTEEWILIDLMTPGTNPIDSFAVIFDKEEGYKYTEAAALYIQANDTADFSAPAVSESLSLDTTWDVITHFFSSYQNYRYWRLKIVDPSNPLLYVEIPKLFLAKATQLSQMPNLDFVDEISDTSRLVSNPYGNTYVDSLPTRRRISLDYSYLTSSDMETLQTIHRRNGQRIPIAIAIDATAAVFDKDRFFIYGRLQGELKASNPFYSYFNSSISVLEEL